jgi:hypothetical protein
VQEHAPGLWSEARPLRVGKVIPIGTRMSVIRLPDGGLLLHSPVAIDAALRARLDALGPVRCLVAPNRVHHLFVASAAHAYPDARRFGAPGLPEKRGDLVFHALLGDEPAPEWGGAVETHLVRGIPYLNEVVFWHRPSRTLVVTDLVFNVQRADAVLTRLFWRVNGAWRRFGPSRMLRSLVRDRAGLRRSIDRVLAWDFDRVLLAHGDALETGGREALRDAYAWL